MKEKNIFLFLIATIFILTAMLFTNIGYANENISNYNINNLSKEFNVKFNKNSKYISNNINIIDDQTATLSNIVLTEVGEKKSFTIPVINTSNDTSTRLNTTIFNSNTEYFKVTCTTSKSILNAKSDEAIITIDVELIKTPIYSSETTEIEININANPIYKAS